MTRTKQKSLYSVTYSTHTSPSPASLELREERIHAVIESVVKSSLREPTRKHLSEVAVHLIELQDMSEVGLRDSDCGYDLKTRRVLQQINKCQNQIDASLIEAQRSSRKTQSRLINHETENSYPHEEGENGAYAATERKRQKRERK